MQVKAAGLGEILIREGLISSADLDEALAEQARTRERLGEILSRRKLITEEDLINALSRQLGHPRFDPAQHAIEPAALEFVPLEFARRHNLLPVSLDEQTLVVALSDPQDVEVLDGLHSIAARGHRQLKILVAPAELLSRLRENHYARVAGSRSVRDLIDKVVDEIAEIGVVEGEPDDQDAERHAQDAGIINLVDQVIVQALQERATDIHIEPQESGLIIRYRVDGLLYDALTPPRAVYTGTISRIKILANMDIAERRAPQDGRFTLRRDNREVDIRVSAIPTIHGEKLVLRLLDKTGFNYSLRDLGFGSDDYALLVKTVHYPYGMILLSGPTGSGKSTTLYASLLELRSEALNILTVEDPVEYQIERINQVPVNERKNLTFASALRSFLRQDPDVIMVGEIRDSDTADIAVRAALTGHMVLSTIHANDAPSTAVRLLSMGIEPFMAASALTLVAAQRLVRRNCLHCREEYVPGADVLVGLGDVTPVDGSPPRFMRGTGCAACKGRGYQGRVAIVEMMHITPGLRQLIAQQRPAGELRQLAVQEGLRTLRQSGVRCALEGTTTPDEVLRVCMSDE